MNNLFALIKFFCWVKILLCSPFSFLPQLATAFHWAFTHLLPPFFLFILSTLLFYSLLACLSSLLLINFLPRSLSA